MTSNPKPIIEVTDWIPKVINCLKPFDPEIKKLSLNYKSRDSEISLALNIPEKSKFRKIEIPRYHNFEISSIMSGNFDQIKLENVVEVNNSIKINFTNLKDSEKYLLNLKGVVPKKTLDTIVYVQPSVNKDRTEDTDKYWLNSMIKDVESLEELWNGLDIDDVSAGVNIGIERYISAKLPEKLNKGLEALRKYADAGRKGNRNDVLTAWKTVQNTRGSKISVQEILDLFKTLTASEFFSGFVDVDSPYNLGEIENKEILRTLPEDMYVEALTKLNLKQPTAKGYMNFRKKKYVECVEKKFNEIG